MANLRDLNQAQVLANFVSGEWNSFFAVSAGMHSVSSYVTVGEKSARWERTAERVRRELELDLKRLLAGDNVLLIATKIDKLTTRMRAFHVCKVGTTAGEPSRNIEHTGKVKLGNIEWNVGYSVSNDYNIQQIFYTLLREAIENRTIERIKFCRRQECKKVFYQKSTIGEYCSGQCRWGNRANVREKKK